MSEPKTKAKTVEKTPFPGLLHWWVEDDRIGSFQSDSYALELEKDKYVLIDPLPLEEKALATFKEVETICLTGSCHQRSAWRYRNRFGAKVYAPEGAEGLEEKADVYYKAGSKMPGWLIAVHAPGPTEVHYAFYLNRGDGALFCADVLIHVRGILKFVEDKYQDAPRTTRDTAKSFLNRRFGVLCCSHGGVVAKDPRGMIEAVLEANGNKT